MPDQHDSAYEDPHKVQRARQEAHHTEPGPDNVEGPTASEHKSAYPASLLHDYRLNTHGNQPIRVALMRQVQQTYGNRAARRLLKASMQRQPATVTASRPVIQRALIDDFAGKFKDAADIIRNSPDALKLVKEAEAAGSKFGGYSEEGPGKSAWPYTSGDTVYVPKAHTDKVIALSDFLFELNNAIRKPAFDKVITEAVKGSKGKLTAKQYAHDMVEQEVEGMLRLGKVWFETKKTMGKGDWNKYDGPFYLNEYKAFKEGKKTKDDLVKNVLARTYAEGAHAGKTVEQYYMHQYENLSGGK